MSHQQWPVLPAISPSSKNASTSATMKSVRYQMTDNSIMHCTKTLAEQSTFVTNGARSGILHVTLATVDISSQYWPESVIICDQLTVYCHKSVDMRKLSTACVLDDNTSKNTVLTLLLSCGSHAANKVSSANSFSLDCFRTVQVTGVLGVFICMHPKSEGQHYETDRSMHQSSTWVQQFYNSWQQLLPLNFANITQLLYSV